MNAFGIAIVWCIVQVTLMSLLAAGLYLLVRRLRPAAAGPTVFAGMMMIVLLSLMMLSPWPRWSIDLRDQNQLAAKPAGEKSNLQRQPQASPEITTNPQIDPNAEPNTSPTKSTSSDYNSSYIKSPRPENIVPSAEKSSIASGASIDDFGEKDPSDSGADRLEPAPAEVTEEVKTQSVPSVESVKSPLPPAKAPEIRDSRASDAQRILLSFVNELSQPQAADPASGWRWPEIVAILLLAAMACGFLWLVLGVVAVRRQSLRGRPVHDSHLLELVDVIRAELSCRRPVEVRQSDELVTAATVGWRKPVLLLPNDWTRWTPEQCRAVLAHEIAHARSHDFMALLCGQLGLILHFYHPVVHWLMNRLRLEQELAADAAAASISGGQRQYLTTIAELALSRQDRPLLWPARTFLPTRNTFLRRIAMLRDSKLHFDRLSPVTRMLTIGVVVLGGLLVAGLRAPHPASADEAVSPIAEKDTAKPSEPNNLLLNPGMEQGDESADNWIQGNQIDGVKYAWDKNVASEGKASLCIEKTANRYFPIAGWSQTIERKGDLPFLEVSAQVKTKKMFKAILDVIFLDKNDQPISHEWAAYIGDKTGSSSPANHDWKKYSGTVKIPEGTAKISVQLQDYGPGIIWFDDVQARYVQTKSPSSTQSTEKNADKNSTAGDNIIEGIGWGKVKVGMNRHDLIEALGNPDNDPASEYLQWNKKHIECSLHPGGTVVTEVRFNPGFKGSLANGVKLGSPAADVEKFYGDKPTEIYKRDNGAENHEYFDKGIMLWTYQGKITQIIVMKPTNAEDKIIEGIGWGKVKVGMNRHDLIEVLGNPDNDPASEYLQWNKKHIECSLHPDGTAVTEVRFNPGFKGSLANGVKLGSPAADVEKFYGDKPTEIYKRDNGAENHEYFDKGIMLWTYQGKITQIIVMKPTNTETVKSPEKSAKDDITPEKVDSSKLLEQGWQLWKDGQMDEAIVIFNRYLEIDNKNTAAWNGLGWASFNSGKIPEAEKAFLELLKLNPNHAPALNGLGQINLLRKDYEKAEPYFLKAVKASSQATAAWYGLAKLYILQEKYDEAEKWFQKIVDSGEADEYAAQLLQAAKEKNLSNELRSIIEPQVDTTEKISMQDTEPSNTSKSLGKIKELSFVGESTTDKMSFADSGFAMEFERPADMKSINAVKIFGTRYGRQPPPTEIFHIYLLDENRKILEEIPVPYGKVDHGQMKWYTFEFPAVQVPEKFFVALWFDAQATKGVFMGKDMNVEQTHSWIGLPDTGYEKVDDRFDWMIRAVVSDDEGKQPTRPKVKTYGPEVTADTESSEAIASRTWNDATGAFSLEAEFAGVEDGKVKLKKADGNIVPVPLDRLSKEDQDYVAQQSEAKKSSGSSTAKELAQDDGKNAGQSSIPSGGHAVRFEADADSNYVTSVSLFGSRYGEARPPKEDFNVWICDEHFKPIATFHFPYSSFARSAPVWKSFKVKPTKVPQKFIVCFGFNPQATKGVFVCYDGEGSGNSLIGVPGKGEPRPFQKGDWLIRCKVENRGEKAEK